VVAGAANHVERRKPGASASPLRVAVNSSKWPDHCFCFIYNRQTERSAENAAIALKNYRLKVSNASSGLAHRRRMRLRGKKSGTRFFRADSFSPRNEQIAKAVR